VVLVMVIGKAVGAMQVVAAPMAAFFPSDSVGGIATANLVALLVIVLMCFAAGMFARLSLAKRVVEGLENSVMMKIPGYSFMRSMVRSVDDNDLAGLKPVLVNSGDTARIAFEIERLADGRHVIYLPSPPSPMSGLVQVYPTEQIVYLDVPATSVVDWVQQYGRGTDQLINKQMGAQA
jgi:uncharacterized membrane protein